MTYRHRLNRAGLVGRYGKYAPYADGMDDYIQIADAPSLRLTNAFTAILLFNIEKIQANKKVLKKGNGFTIGHGGSSDMFMQLGDSTGAQAIGFTNGISVTSRLSRYDHWVFLYDKDAQRVEVLLNKVIQRNALSSFTGWKNIDSQTNNLFVLSSGASAGVQGRLPIVRIYNRALSQAEIEKDFIHTNNLEATSIRNGLVLELLPKSNLSDPNTWSDNSGNNNNGTVNGARWFAI